MKQYSTIYCNIIQYSAIEYNMIRYVAISSCNEIRYLLYIMENNSNIDKLYIYRERISPRVLRTQTPKKVIWIDGLEGSEI